MSKVEHRVKYLRVEVTKGKMQKIVTDLPQWEAQVVIALWGDEAQVVGESFRMRELPEVNDEFTRLANKYGPRDEEVPIVARVYGSFGPGLRSLEQEFSASTMSIETETAVEEAVEEDGEKSDDYNGLVSGKAVEAGTQLPGSDETFGADAVPAVKDDVPFYAGNPELEQAMADDKGGATDQVDITDLTGEGSEVAEAG